MGPPLIVGAAICPVAIELPVIAGAAGCAIPVDVVALIAAGDAPGCIILSSGLSHAQSANEEHRTTNIARFMVFSPRTVEHRRQLLEEPRIDHPRVRRRRTGSANA
jgi:hypothetical protein